MLFIYSSEQLGEECIIMSERNLNLREVEVNAQGHTAAKGLSGIYTQVRLLLRSWSTSHASEEQMAYFSLSPQLEAELDLGPPAV